MQPRMRWLIWGHTLAVASLIGFATRHEFPGGAAALLVIAWAALWLTRPRTHRVPENILKQLHEDSLKAREQEREESHE